MELIASGNKALEDGYKILYRVDDYVLPEISLNTADTVIHDVNQPYSPQQVSVFDNYYDVSDISVSKSGTVNAYKLGIYSEEYTAIDGSGNKGKKVRYVKVVDRESPQIITSAVNVCVGSPFWAMSDVIVSDNYYAETDLLPLVQIVNHNVNIWKSGLYFINYQITDPSGNKSEVVLRPIWVQYPPDCENTFNGVVDLNAEQSVRVYPNPSADGKFTLEVKTGNTEPVSISVVSVLGTEVYSTEIMSNGTATTQIDLGQASTGMYLVKISSSGQTTTRRIVVGK